MPEPLNLDWNPDWKASCAAMHVGLWLIEPQWFREAAAAASAGLFTVKRIEMAVEAESRAGSPSAEPSKPYFLDAAGLAMIAVEGAMTKGSTKFGTSTLAVRKAVRAATRDSEVKAIMLAIDSPGGTTAGTQELAADIEAANRVKPVYAHIDDLGASAAYWVASQARRITAGPTAQIGSIGTMAVVEDLSGLAEKKGIVVHVIATGPFKGAGTPGTKITDDQLAYLQTRVDALNEHFLAAVSRGRNVPAPVVKDWSDGRVWIADQAKHMGLIDEVQRMDDAVAFARREIAQAEAAETPQSPVVSIRVQETECVVKGNIVDGVPQEEAEPEGLSAEEEDRKKRVRDALRRAQISHRAGRRA